METKDVLRWSLLSRGDSLHYYLIDIKGKKGLIVMLDKKPLDSVEDVEIKE